MNLWLRFQCWRYKVCFIHRRDLRRREETQWDYLECIGPVESGTKVIWECLECLEEKQVKWEAKETLKDLKQNDSKAYFELQRERLKEQLERLATAEYR